MNENVKLLLNSLYGKMVINSICQSTFQPCKPDFCYADTDSLHCDMPVSELKEGIIRCQQILPDEGEAINE